MPIPFYVSGRSLTFIAGDQPMDIPAEHENFEAIRDLLFGQAEREVNEDELLVLADPLMAMAMSGTGLDYEGDRLVLNGETVNAFWTDRIESFKTRGLDFEPLVKALDSLLQNKTPLALDRVPHIMEKGLLGVFPDGRLASLMIVRDAGVDPALAALPEDSLEGYRVGAMGYVSAVTGNYDFRGLADDRRILLVAVWPKDVIATPGDNYTGNRFRVREFEVIRALDRNQVAEFVNANRDIVGNAAPSDATPEAAPDRFQPDQSSDAPNLLAPVFDVTNARVGDFVGIRNDPVVRSGVYPITHLDLRPNIRRPVRIAYEGVEIWVEIASIQHTARITQA